jgi:hypothetical protein
MFILTEQVPMKDGEIVEPIEIREDGMPLYPQGIVIKAKVTLKENAKATVHKQSSKQIDFENLIEEDTFKNGYGWKKIEKEIQDFRDQQYLEKQRYWSSEEGQERKEMWQR